VSFFFIRAIETSIEYIHIFLDLSELIYFSSYFSQATAKLTYDLLDFPLPPA